MAESHEEVTLKWLLKSGIVKRTLLAVKNITVDPKLSVCFEIFVTSL